MVFKKNESKGMGMKRFYAEEAKEPAHKDVKANLMSKAGIKVQSKKKAMKKGK